MTFDRMCERIKRSIGTRVKIVRQPRNRSYDLIGREGTIISTYARNVAIEIDGVRNKSSSYGYFYFEPGDFLYLDEFTDTNIMEENNMNTITNYHNAVKIRFLDDHYDCKYIYANFDIGVEVGDLVVVKPAHHEMALARVVEVIDKNDFETNREVVVKVDTFMYDDRVANRSKAAELKTKMQERAKQLQDIALYQMLAKDDPAMMELLNEYQAIPKV